MEGLKSPESDAPAVPQWRLGDLPRCSCAACGYDLSHNPSQRCPECGYSMTQDDIQLAELRRYFLRLTGTAPYTRHILCTFFLITAVPYVGLLIALPPMLSVFFLSAGRGKGVTSRLRRRVWLMSSFWLHVPWIVTGLSSWVYDWMYWRFLSRSMVPRDLVDYPAGFLFVGCVLVFAVCLWAWRGSLRRLASKATLPGDDPLLRWRSPGTRVALLPYALGVLVGSVPVMMWTLDTFWPGWA